MRAADLVAIENIHKPLEKCTLTQDAACLTFLWSDNGIKVDVPGAPVVGIKALGEMYAKFHSQYPEFKALKCMPELRWANAIVNMSANADSVTVSNNEEIRLLKRQGDGSWKFALVGLK